MSNWRIIRIVLLMLMFGGIAIAAYLFYEHELYFCVFFSILLEIVIIVSFIYASLRVLRRLAYMVECLSLGDFTVSFSTEGEGNLEQKLMQNINDAVSQFRTRLAEREKKYRYLETLLDTVDTSLLVAERDGKVIWMNRSAVQDLCGHAIHQLGELGSLNTDFPKLLETLQPGELKVIRIYKEDFMQDMAVTITEYADMGMGLRIINLKNICSVLEENEMEAWQKLVRVLTHEIMNSITPIISLSDTLCDRLLQYGIEEESLTFQGMKTIHRRSNSLLHFVENYRRLSRLSTPVLAPVTVGDLLGDIKKLFTSSDVTYTYKIENERRVLMVDRSQMEQVLINLLKNAGEACEDRKDAEVIVETFYHPDRHLFVLSVTDNGCGILPEVLDRIFIPFFTTKSSGSGIGLSLCKQIMSLHGGSIQVTSEDGKGSCFILKMLVK